jgi:alcohol oxidase
VEYVNDPITHPGTDEVVRVARASRLVVLSAGAFGSSTILERSGIGGKTILDKNSLEQIVELPGVGEGYRG